jgi:hypothetical protein
MAHQASRAKEDVCGLLSILMADFVGLSEEVPSTQLYPEMSAMVATPNSTEK